MPKYCWHFIGINRQLVILNESPGSCVIICVFSWHFLFHFLSSGCHESCSDCYGPSSEDCVSCSDPAALLKDRQCVQDCGPGFYSRDGICYGKQETLIHTEKKSEHIENQGSSSLSERDQYESKVVRGSTHLLLGPGLD